MVDMDASAYRAKNQPLTGEDFGTYIYSDATCPTYDGSRPRLADLVANGMATAEEYRRWLKLTPSQRRASRAGVPDDELGQF